MSPISKTLSFSSLFLFLLIIFSIPFQKSFFIITPFSFLNDTLIEYNSFYLTTTEILLIILSIVNIGLILKHLSKLLSIDIFFIFFLLFLFIVSLNLFNSENISLSLHKNIHFIFWVLFFLNFKIIINKNKKLLIPILLTFLLSAFVESFISIIQFLMQRSIGLSFLGESFINPNILGVSKINFMDIKIIRTYGTLPHPNILACFMFCAITINYFLLLKTECSTWNILFKKLPNYLNPVFKKIVIIAPFLLYFSLIITFSRIFIFLGFLFPIIILFYYKKYLFKFIPIIIFNIIIVFIFHPLISIRVSENQVVTNTNLPLREFYNTESLKYIKNNYLLGIGSGNFVYYLEKNNPHLMPWDLQPVHNIFLLAISEQGIILFSIILFTIILFLQKNTKQKIFWWGISLLLLSGFFDHLLYSFPQGSLSFMVLLSALFLTCKQNVPRGTFC